MEKSAFFAIFEKLLFNQFYFNSHTQAANLAGFRVSEDPRFEAGIPDFMNGILNFSIHFNVVHRKVDWRNPKMKSLNSMPAYTSACGSHRSMFSAYEIRASERRSFWLKGFQFRE